MDRSRTSVSLANELSHFMIEKEYLNTARHKQSLEHSRKCAYFYERISTEIEDYYHIIYQLPEKVKSSLEASMAKPSNQFLKFKSFLKNFFGIFTLLSHFQINELSNRRSSLSENREGSFQIFNQSIERYRALQEEFEQDQNNYKTLCFAIQDKFREVISVLKKVEQNFNGKYIKSEHDSFTNDLLRKQKLQQQINSKAQSMAENSRRFEKEIMFHRQKLVSFKYSYIQKISRFCANAKQSLMEILTYMNDLIIQNKQAFAINKNGFDWKAEHTIEEKNLGEYINACVKQYQEKINRYLAIIKVLINIFTEISAQIKEEKGRQVEIVEQMNKYFEYNECNITEVLNTMDIYTIFLKYLSQIGDKLIYSENNLHFLLKNVNKQKQITLTILKCNNSNERTMLSSSQRRKPSNLQSEQTYIEALFEQISPIYIQNILCKIFHDFQETVGRIREKFLLNRPAKKYTDNSMSMSHLETQYSEPERRPFKCDIWLWREWRKEISKQSVDFAEIKSFVGEMGKFLQKYSLDDKQIDKLSCVLSNKKIKGILRLKTHGLTFQAIDNSQQYFVPFFKIDSIDMQLNIMSKSFMIETVHGNLTFVDENVKQIKRFYVSVQKALDYFNENNDEGKVIQQALVISEEEVDFIRKRRLEIEKDLERESDYEHFNTIIVENVTINDVYRVIYSDNKIVAKGKEFACFFDTLMKKFNNTNPTYKSFEPQGPQFYSGAKEVSFKNCPLFSERIIQYDHTLPKIPFMPQSCHNRQTVRVYWVSHEEFHVLQINNTSGAPYTKDFIITMLSKVTRVAEDVEIRFFIKVAIVNDFSLRKMVVGKATDEAKWGNGIMAEEIKKCMLGYKRRQGKDSSKPQSLQESKLSDKTIVKSYKNQIKALEGKNRMLMCILAGVLVLNIMIKLFF